MQHRRPPEPAGNAILLSIAIGMAVSLGIGLAVALLTGWFFLAMVV